MSQSRYFMIEIYNFQQDLLHKLKVDLKKKKCFVPKPYTAASCGQIQSAITFFSYSFIIINPAV